MAASSDVGVERLGVYAKSVALADEVAGCVRRWPSFERWTVGVQLVRAADSVGANLAEAYGRGPFPDRRRLAFIARGSEYELEHWLRRAKARDLSLPEAAAERASEIGRMLNGFLKAWEPSTLRTED